MSSVPPYGQWLPPLAEPPEGTPPPDASDARPPGPAGEPRWAPWTAWAALLTALGFALFGAIVVSLVGSAFGADFDDPTPAVNIVATIGQDAAFIGAALLFAARTGTISRLQFGFVRARLWPAIGWILLAYLAYGLLGQLWAEFVDLPDVDRLPDSLGADESTVALVAVCLLVTIVAPIAEEVFFRGYFFGALRNWHGVWPAALLTGAVFGGIHVGSAEPEYLLPLAILGVALCIIRWRTGSLLPCIALHAVNNALAFGVSEDWTAGQTLLLIAGAVSMTLLLCRPFLAPPPARA